MISNLLPKRIVIDISSSEYMRILGGPPESSTMRSGFVVLQPGEKVGKHSTGVFEEILVVMEGEGVMIFGDGTQTELSTHTVCYCPPETEHDVFNNGNRPLKYIYIVARA